MQQDLKFPENSATLIIGASGGIGSALVRRYLDLHDCVGYFVILVRKG